MSNFDQFLQDKMWTLRLARAHVPVRLLETPKKNGPLYRRLQRHVGLRKAFLESFGYGVLTAPSGGEGLELASICSVDVVIVDYFMPEMSGHEVAIEMRRLRPQAPIIMLSGAGDVPELALKSTLSWPRIVWRGSCCPRLRN
jgi:hypothetical protein